MALWYGIFVAVTVLAVMGLGRLKRWLLGLAENLSRTDCTVPVLGNNGSSEFAQGGGDEKSSGGLSGVSAAADQ